MYYSIHGVILILPCTEVTSGWNLDDCYIWFSEDKNDPGYFLRSQHFSIV